MGEKKQILFQEQQRFNQWWIWLILFTSFIPLVYGLYKQLVRGEPFGNNPVSNTNLILLTSTVMLFITALFFCLRLKTVIKEDGIYVQFFPFHLKYKAYPWEKLNRIYIRTYSPLSEYGGWGIKASFSGNGWVYNVSGKSGLQLVCNDHKKLLIGTQKPTELEKVLRSIGRYTD